MVLSERAQFLVDNLDWAGATGVDDARPEYFQLALWSDDSPFRIENKSRQIAWSWALAADFLADALLRSTDGIFVSISLEEAKEKIRYAKTIYEHLRVGGLPKLVRDAQFNLEFSNGARLTSLPSKPARGRARSNVGLDEFAHAQRDRAIYTGSLPVISKGGRLRVGSSPLGASGVFWEVYTQSLRPYSGYKRRATPWWHVYSFCNNVREAVKLAPELTTAQQVERFGNDRIKAIFDNMPWEDFSQEYCCLYIDESTAWITWDEIKAAQALEPECYMAKAISTLTPEVGEAIESLAKAIAKGGVEGSLAVGVDIGRTRNTTEIYAVGLSTTNTYPLRLAITLDNMEFDDQLGVVLNVLQQLPVVSMKIDQNGIGRNLAENAAKRYPVKVMPENFTNETKRVWATDAKMLIQQGRTPLPVDKDIAYQIHSIKRMVTGSNNLVFDTERNEKAHADKFWAWALALAGAYHRPQSSAIKVPNAVNIFGARKSAQKEMDRGGTRGRR
jgi:phage FluMu gp28-like protein